MVAVGRLPMLKVFNFFSQIIIISYMRLKFQSLNIMDPQNMSKPIPYCSNFNKIVFWPWEGVFFIEMKNFKNSLLLYALEHLKTNPDFWNSKIGILSPMVIYPPPSAARGGYIKLYSDCFHILNLQQICFFSALFIWKYF